MRLLIDKSEWIHYFTRPFDLFGTSLWYTWYADYASQLVTKDISDMICIEDDIHVVRNYRKKADLDHLTQSVGKLALEKKETCYKMLEKAFVYNKKAEQYLTKQKSLLSFDKMLNFFFETALYATILPHFVIEGLHYHGGEDRELTEISEKLRSVSYYPKLLSEIITPMARDLLTRQTLPEPEKAITLLTITELQSGDFSKVEERSVYREENKKYVFTALSKVIDITWHKDTTDFIQQIEDIHADVLTIQGQTAFKGKVQGTIRVVKTLDGKGVTFNQGDILVSINSNPNLMHLIKKAGALVTDEGGVTCHAAIVSRELKISCIIATKVATQVLKDGMKVEVDADNGSIQILN